MPGTATDWSRYRAAAPRGGFAALPLWQRALAWAAWLWIAGGFIASAIGVLWVLTVHVAPLVPWAAALLIQAGGEVVRALL